MFSKKSSRFTPGFTLIELLVVIAIIGLLMSIVIFSLGLARLRARDTRRISDMIQVRTGLDVMLNQVGGYADTATWDANVGNQITCNGITFFQVPKDPLAGYTYTYTSGLAGTGFPGCAATIYPSYKIQFQTEDMTSLGPAGTYYISPTGFSSTAPF